jgi:hypothetical protein
MTMAYMTPEEIAQWEKDGKEIDAYLDSLDGTDEELQDRLFKQMPWDAKTLQEIKNIHGSDYIKNRGYNIERALKEFGSDWLDR